MGATMSAREIAVKKYVVRLSQEDRKRLDDMIHKGKSSAQKLMKARILLKADVSEGGEGWSDDRRGAGDQRYDRVSGTPAAGRRGL